MPKLKKVCGNCKYYQWDSAHGWGWCEYPLPQWISLEAITEVDAIEGPGPFWPDRSARECKAYEQASVRKALVLPPSLLR